MKKLIFFLLLLCSFAFGQSGLDSLRLVVPVGHTEEINNASFSSDNRFAVTASNDNTARIFDVQTGKQVQVLYGHKERVLTAVFSPDSKYVLTSSWDSTAILFDAVSGKIVYTIEHENIVNKAIFSHNGLFIVTSSFDKKVKLFEVKTGKLLKTLEGNKKIINTIKISPDDNFIITAGQDSLALIFSTSTGNLVQVLTGHNREIKNVYFNAQGNRIITSSYDKTSNIYDVSTGKIVFTLKGHKNGLDDATFSFDGRLVFTQSNENLILWDATNGSEILKLKMDSHIEYADFLNNSDCIILLYSDKVKVYDPSSRQFIKTKTIYNTNKIAFSFDKKLFLVIHDKFNIHDNFNLSFYNLNNFNKISEFKSKAKEINDVNFNSKGNKIVASLEEDNISTFNMYPDFSNKSILETRSSSSVNFIFDDKYILSKEYGIFESSNYEKIFDSELNKCYHSPKCNAILVDDTYENGTIIFDLQELKIKKIENRRKGKFKYIQPDYVFSPDGSLIASTIRTMNLYNEWVTNISIYSSKSGRLIKKVKIFKYINIIDFSPDNKNLLLVPTRLPWNAMLFNISNAELHKEYKQSGRIENVKFSKNGDFLLTTSVNDVILFNTKTCEELMAYKGHTDYVISAAFNFEENCILTASDDYTARVFDVKSGKVVHVLQGHDGKLKKAIFSPNNNFVATTSNDKFLILWDFSTGANIYKRLFLENNNWFIQLPNSPYYMCSKDASKMLHYVTPSLKVIGFEQLDPVYNRPDIVLDSIGRYFGNEDRGMIEEYRKAWEKRIERLGLKDQMDKLGKGEISVPNAEIENADSIAYENSEGTVKLLVKANDPKYKLRRFNVLVNEVPVYGSNGLSISELNRNEWDTTLSIPLSLGENKIQVSVMNELGLENFKYPIYVNYKSEKVVPKTHFIGIAVDKFDNGMDLSFCVKDVKDLGKHFSKLPNSNIKLLTEKEVTKENITKLKAYLKTTSVHDRVIISCSSHGILDSARHFYLATYDTDFDKPEFNGISYEILDGLLDDIPARKKLLLLDACNSGENDEGFAEMDNSYAKGTKGSNVKIGDEIVKESNFKKMNELFVNVRNNSGAYIISATGGIQKALEGEAVMLDGKPLENGSFTYAVLEYFKEYEGIKEMLTVKKLKQYVEQRVIELTNGKQTPTSRQETMEIDWDLH
jgi:WD40 repeat protein